MMLRFLFALAAAGASVAATLQGAANAGLAAQTGLGAALVLNTGVVLICSLVSFFASGSPAIFFPAAAPWLFYMHPQAATSAVLRALSRTSGVALAAGRRVWSYLDRRSAWMPIMIGVITKPAGTSSMARKR
jgi:hypothetical protein